MERLQKIIAASGLASRRQAENWIREGKVMVNGITITQLGSQADPFQDQILVNNKPLPKTTATTYLLYKPRGVVCSRRRQGRTPLVTDLLPEQPGVYPVGRLDKESEGLILVSNEGELAYRLTHPSFRHEKEYQVTISPFAHLTPIEVEKKLKEGVALEDGLAQADWVQVEKRGGTWQIRLVIHEGRYHLVRRMCAALGLKVLRLLRTRISTLDLEKFTPGKYRLLTTAEVRNLLR